METTTTTDSAKARPAPTRAPTVPLPADGRPIGFWLKLVDRLVDERLAATLASEQVTRRAWQVLNVLHGAGGGLTAAEVDEAVRPFLDGAEPTTAPVLDGLRRRGWIEAHGDRYRLAEAGAAARGRLLARVSDDRRALAQGIAPHEYVATIGVLERMARNLGWTG
ncbi:MAG TPA: hypothetical protein VFZ77_04870 [Acidimicrobiales bacterium]